MKIIGWILFIAGILSLIFFGIIGLGRDPHYINNFDMDYLYVAGKCWSEGKSPYDTAVFLDVSRQVHSFPLVSPFAYPPQIGLLSYFLSLWPLWIARIWMTFINVSSAFALAYFCVQLIKKDLRDPANAFILAGIIIGNPFATHVVWMGQTSLISAACVIGGWFLTYNSKYILGGILLGISTIKPQLVILPLLWIMLDRQWRALIVACLTLVILSLVPMIVEGPVHAFIHWYETLKEYQSFLWGLVSFEHVFGLRSLAWSLGIHSPNLMLLGVFFTLILWLLRNYVVKKNILSILTAFGALIIYAHDYDLVIISPLLGTILLLTQNSPLSKIAATLLFIGFFFPQRYIKKFSENSWLWHTREIFLLIALGWVLFKSIQMFEKENDLL